MSEERKPEDRLYRSAIDGRERTAGQERALNSIAAGIFSQGGGRAFLDYLRSITLHRILEPHSSDGELRYLEGMRALFGIIQKRVIEGQKEP